MKSYTTIQNAIASKLSAADTYRYTCLSFTPRKNGYTDSTFKQIAELNSNEPESENTIKDFVERLKRLKLMKIVELYTDGKKRNRYYFPEPEMNFKMISNRILEAELSVSLKGFLIQLFTITLNNSLEINLSMNKICSLIKISLPTARKYLKELENLQLVSRTENGLLLTDTYFLIGNEKQNQIDSIEAKISGCDELTDRFNRTDWNNIKLPIEYWRSVEGGFTNKNNKRVLQPDSITI